MRMGMTHSYGSYSDRRNRNYSTHYGFSSTGKLHLCHERGYTKCGLSKVFVPYRLDDIRDLNDSSNKCMKCFKTKAPKKIKHLVDKDVKTWCKRVGIKL